MIFESTPTIIYQFQECLFDVFDLVLEHRKLPVGLANFMIVVHYIQMISLIFNASNPYLEMTLLNNYLFLGDYNLIFLALRKTPSFMISLFITIVITLLIVVLILGFLYIHVYKDPDDIFQKDLANFLAFVYDCLDHIFLIPCFGVLILNMTCSSYTCGSVEHIILIIWSLVLIIIIVFLQFLYVFCFFNFTFRICDGFSRNPSQRPFLSFLIKISLISFTVVVDISSNYFYVLVAHTFYSWFLLQETLTNYPYHDKHVSKCYGIFISAYFWINCSLLFVDLANIDFFTENLLVITFLGVILFVKLFLTIRNYTIKGLMISDLDEIESDIHLDLKVRLFSQLAQTINVKKHELLLASLLKIHYDKCEDSDCICRRRTDLYDPSINIYGDQNLQFHKDDVFVKHYLIKMIKEGIAKFSDSKLLYLDFIFYNFESLKIYAPIYCFIKYFQQKYQNNLHFSFKFCIHRLLAQLERFLIKKNFNAGLNEKLLIDNVKQFDKGITSLRAKLNKCIDDYAQIWNTLNQNMPDLGVLLKTCNHCIQNNNEVVKQYEMLVELNEQSMKLKNFMEIYCLYISYDELLWGRVEKDIKMPQHMEIGDSLHQDLDYLLHRYNMFDENVGTIIISPNFENMGQILWVSCNIPKLFHYEMNQFRTMNVSALMPEVIGKSHDKILQTFYLTSKEVAINNFRHLWAVNKEGFCFSVNILVKVIPTKDDFEIMGLIHKLNDGDYILTNSEGDLINIGKKLSDVMEITPYTIFQLKINLQLLAPRLTQYYKKVFIEDNDLPDTTNIINSNNIPGEKDLKKERNSSMRKSSKKSKEEDINRANENQMQDLNKQLRFYIFIPEDIEVLTKFQEEEIKKSEAKFDLQKMRERVFKDIKMLIQIRKCFGSSLKKTFSRIDLKKVKKVLRVKASFQHMKFSNGDINFVAIKILYMEIKRPDLISFEKRQKQQKYIKMFLKDIKKIEDNVNILNSNQKALEDQENRDENTDADQNLLNKTPKTDSANDRIKGMLNLFRKKSPNAFLTPKKEKESKNLEKESSMSRQATNLNNSVNNSPDNLTKNSNNKKKMFLEDLSPSPEDLAKKPVKNALKNMLMKIKQGSQRKIPILSKNVGEEEKKNSEANPKIGLKAMFMKKNAQAQPNIKIDENDSPNNNESDLKKKLSPIKSGNNEILFERDKQKKISNIYDPQQNRDPSKKLSTAMGNKIGFGSQSSLKDGSNKELGIFGKGGKNPLSILTQIEENVKNVKERDNISEIESSSPEKEKPKTWTSKFRNILIKKGIFERRPNVAKSPLPKKPQFFIQGLGGAGAGAGQSSNTGGFGGLNRLLKGRTIKKANENDTGTSKSIKSEILGEESDFSSNSDERSGELNVFLKSENSTNKKEDIKRNLKEKMEKMWGLEDQEQVSSIASSAFSNLAQTSLKKIKDNLRKQKTGIRLRISNLLAFLACIIISALTLSQYLNSQSEFNDLFEILQEVNSIAFYNENFLKIFNYYEVRKMISLGYYDWGTDWEVSEKNDIRKALDIMTKLSSADIIQDIATQNGKGTQNNYVFLSYKIYLKIEGTKSLLKMNFLDFFRMYIVAVNSTLDLNSSTEFTDNSIEENDYLAFIFDNFGILEEIIDSNNNFIHELLIDSNYNLKIKVIYIWIFTFLILLISFMIVFPIVYQSKSRIFNTLALFTKIPLRDVEYYNTHYKQVMLNLGRVEEDAELLKAIQAQTEQNQKELIALKRNDGNSFIRTRNYKGINIDKCSYISKVIILFFVVYGLILAKDLKLFMFILDQDNLQGLYIQQHVLMSETYRDFIHYKQTYSGFLSQPNYNLSMYLFELDPGVLSTNVFQSYSQLNFDFKDFYKDMISLNLCEFLASIVMTCKYFDSAYCTKTITVTDLITTYAFDEIWGSCSSGDLQEGMINFMLEISNYLKNQNSLLNSYLKVTDKNQRNQMMLTVFRDNFEYFSYTNLNHLLIIIRKWYYISYEALLAESEIQLTLNKNLLILFIVLIWMVMIFGWWREYNKLKSDSKWVNGFIVLLPLHLIKENQHLKVFLKKKIKITNLDNN